MTKKKLSIYEKIQSVSNEIGNLEKDVKVGKGNYAYKAISDLQVILAINKAEKKYRLISIPKKQELVSSKIERVIASNGKEGFKFIDTIKLTLIIVDLDDEAKQIEVESYGKGIDAGDKGFGKASTYARKIALLNAYKIPTGEDPDANKSDDINPIVKINEKKIELLKYFDGNIKEVDNVLSHFKLDNINDITDAQVDLIHKTYKQKKLL